MINQPRRYERIPMLGHVAGEIMVFEPMAITEVSVAGVGIETRFPLHLNSLHDLRLTLGSRSVVLKGRVVYSHISEVDQDLVVYGSGLEFVEPPEYARIAIAEFLDEVKGYRAGIAPSGP